MYRMLYIRIKSKIMDYLNLSPLSSYRFKLVGICITVLTVIVLAVFSILGIESIPNNIFMIFITMGLITISTSKEKIEDERIQKIRGYSSRVSFTYIISVLIALGVTQQLSSKEIVNNPLLIAAIGLCIYIYIFHFSIRKDFLLIHKEESLSESLKRNKGFYLIYIITSIAIGLFMLFELLIR